MSLLSGQQLGRKIVGLVVGIAALAGLAVLELRVGGKKSLMVGWAAEGLLAACLEKSQRASHNGIRNSRVIRDQRSVCGR